MWHSSGQTKLAIYVLSYTYSNYKLYNQLTKTDVKKIGPDLTGTGNSFISLKWKFSSRASNKNFKKFDLLGNPKMQFWMTVGGNAASMATKLLWKSSPNAWTLFEMQLILDSTVKITT